MAKSVDPRTREPEPPGGYLHWSRDAAVSLFAVLPLWVAYEVLRLCLTPDERNGAEILLRYELGRLGEGGHLVLAFAFCLLVVAAAKSLVRRRVPWLRVAGVIALEGTVWALMLGPVASVLASWAKATLVAAPAVGHAHQVLVANLVGSLGAGIFEELVFRLGLMSALVWIGLRAVRAWSLPTWLAGAFGVAVSALVFSWFHHLCGEPFDGRVFAFRTMAGVLLGALMWGRGYGVCVYTHTIYNLHFYLATDG